MKTYEMVALAEKDGCTYINGCAKYNKIVGFIDTAEYEWELSNKNIKTFLFSDGWVKVEEDKLMV